MKKKESQDACEQAPHVKVRRFPPLVRKAKKALEIAVKKAIEEHWRFGRSIVIWRNGRVVRIPAHRI